MTPTDAAYRQAYIAGMERGGRICAADHPDLVDVARGAGETAGAWRALAAVLGLVLVAALLGKARRT